MVKLLTAINQTHKGESFDERFIYFLLSSILTKKEKQNRNVDKLKLGFAQKIFGCRIRDDDASNRMEKFGTHAKLLIRDIREKSRKLNR